ncbi:MAG: rod shape-determining protein MreC [Actinobacteria bacterium]|uniref:Cell shape-determining protein MreC n=1 Tax=freshwater metagenome TaxID=449393 RepID=A0A6J7CMN2_9ZZZZ|nr:rod shape-determining protein MreC [Actinomycetota bacterium]
MLSRRTRVLLATLFVATLTFVILDLRGGQGPFASFRSAGSAVVGGGEQVGNAVYGPFLGIREWWGTWGDQREQLAELTTQNNELRLLVERSAADRARAEQLDGLLRVSGVGQYRIVPAEVIAVGPAQEFAWTVTIDAGSGDGVERDMSVINGQGLVGRVQSVTRNSATVVLLVDASVSVGARVGGSSEIGILSGTGRQDSLEFQLLNPAAGLVKGDALVTFGSKGGRPYSPGIPIGEVVDVAGTAGQLTRIATIRPYVNVSALGVVGVVIRPPRVDPRDSVLPDPSRPVLLPSAPATANPSPSPTSPGSTAMPSASATATAEQEQAATPVPSSSGGF